MQRTLVSCAVHVNCLPIQDRHGQMRQRSVGRPLEHHVHPLHAAEIHPHPGRRQVLRVVRQIDPLHRVVRGNTLGVERRRVRRGGARRLGLDPAERPGPVDD